MHSRKQTILDAVCRRVREDDPHIAVGTVYRNLALLTESGALRRIDLPGAPTRYDGNVTPHEHILCLRCGELRDLELGVDVLRYLREKTGEDVRSYQLNLGCICPKCAAEESAEAEKG